MGSIKQTFIKRIGNDLKKQYTERFDSDFEKNKTVINELIETGILKCESKGLRNRLAGYMATVKEHRVQYKPRPKAKVSRFRSSRDR